MLQLRTSIWLLLIIAFFHFTTAERYRCSISEENCVFPFNASGVTYNECTSGIYKPWCNTDGSHGWAYCKVCEEDKTTSTISTTTSTTKTTTPTTTTNQPTTTSSTTSTTDPLATTTITTHSATANKTDPLATTTKTTHTTSTISTTNSTPTTDNIPIPSAKGTVRSVPQSTTSTPKTTTSTSSPTTTSTTDAPGLEDDGATADNLIKQPVELVALEEDEDDFLNSTTNSQEKGLDDGATESANTVRKPISTEKTEAPTTVPVSTTQPTTAKVCTHSGKPCHFPFEYSGEMYYSCADTIAYSWCYTDASTEEYTYCIPCTESSTSTTSATTTRTPTTSSTNVKSASSTKQPTTLVRKGSTSTTSATTTRTSTTSSTNVKSALSTKQPTTPVRKGTDSRMLSGKDTPGETSNTKTVVIIVAVLTCLAILVTVAIVSLYIRKRRRNSRKDGAEKNGNVGESGEVLLSQNINGNHKSTNDGSSQEMQPLNSKPREENGVDSGAGGDCNVINEKADETTTNVTV